MSENIIFANNFAGWCLVVFVGLLLIGLAIYAVANFIKSSFEKKIKACEKSITEVKDYCKEQTKDMSPYLDSEVEGQKEKREALEAERDEKIKGITATKEMYEKKARNVKYFLEAYNPSAATIGVMLFGLLLLSLTGIGGNISSPHRVEGVSQDDVSVVMYYLVDYKNVEQDTLTVFVKNDSKSLLKEATIVEKNTGTEAKVTDLEFGREKITSMSVYSPNGEYEFEIKDVEFYK